MRRAGSPDWREGEHDDLVLAAGLACWYALRGSKGAVPCETFSFSGSIGLGIPDDVELTEAQRDHALSIGADLDWLNELMGRDR